MSTVVQTRVAPPPLRIEKIQPEELFSQENGNRWDEKTNQGPKDILEAYARERGPYTVENAEMMLEEEPVELFNGWLVLQEMTHLIERRSVANLQEMLSISARNLGFGQAIPDQAECLLSNGDVFKPDASLISWDRLRNDIHYSGRRKRPLLNGGPELAIEVRSRSNTRDQEKAKRALYFRNKVKVIWDVDEAKQVIWVYRAETPDKPDRYAKDDLINCEPFLPGWRRRVADIFAPEVSAKVVAGEVAEAWRAEGEVEGFAKGEVEGFAKGEMEGFAKGEMEGVTKTLRDLLPLLAQAHFRVDLPSDLSARLAQCNLAQLQALQTLIPTSENLETWLTKI